MIKVDGACMEMGIDYNKKNVNGWLWVSVDTSFVLMIFVYGICGSNMSSTLDA